MKMDNKKRCTMGLKMGYFVDTTNSHKPGPKKNNNSTVYNQLIGYNSRPHSLHVTMCDKCYSNLTENMRKTAQQIIKNVIIIFVYL